MYSGWRLVFAVLVAIVTPWRRRIRLQQFTGFAALALVVVSFAGFFIPNSLLYEVFLTVVGGLVMSAALVDFWQERRYLSRVKLLPPVLRGEVSLEELPPDMQEDVKVLEAWIVLNTPAGDEPRRH